MKKLKINPFVTGWGKKEHTLAEFFHQFNLTTHQQRILVLTYWVGAKRGQFSLTEEEILATYQEGDEPPPANIRRYLSNLVVEGFMTADKNQEGHRVYTLTNAGIRKAEDVMLES